jgi:sigma-B regulation protein RsbU (phosphoserine phosphatase)
VKEALLERLAPELGPIQLTVTRPAQDVGPGSRVLNVESRPYLPIGQIASGRRALPPPRHWLDLEIAGFSTLEAVWLDGGGESKSMNPVLVFFSVRPSQLNRLLFASLGTFSDFATVSLVIMGVIFLLLELGALSVGVNLTRHVTQTVDELYSATQKVQRGDFAHHIRIGKKDQLGALGEAFNTMAGSISELIEEQRERQRLENELSIAREVQAQLFPQSLPRIPGIELAALCRPARVVSGDYYDFLPLGPAQVGLAIADISGKGISAALLMACLQAALRSQVLADEQASHNTAELVSRLNRHLFLNTSQERYATFFYGVYDASRRTLHYTNAGHFPPFCLVGDRVQKLEEGGMVVGLFDNCRYDQGLIQLERGALLVAYSDGLIESENVYGEEFGRDGLLREVLGRRNSPPQQLAEALLAAEEEWAGTPEQADDMTVIVARVG